MRLIPDARLAWRFGSVQAAALLLIVTALQADVLPMLRPLMSDRTALLVAAGLAALVIVLRVIAQPGLDPARQQLALDQAEQESIHFDHIEHLAAMLYEAGGLSKAWEHVSPESKAKWRQVAAAAVKARVPAADAAGEHF